jgi:hypothetical protein
LCDAKTCFSETGGDVPFELSLLCNRFFCMYDIVLPIFVGTLLCLFAAVMVDRYIRARRDERRHLEVRSGMQETREYKDLRLHDEAWWDSNVAQWSIFIVCFAVLFYAYLTGEFPYNNPTFF